jgi:hypothetical protein
MKSRQVTTMEDPAPYHTGPTDGAEPPLTIDDLVAQAHARRQGIPYETGEQWLQRLPERLRTLADYVLSEGQRRRRSLRRGRADRQDRERAGRRGPQTPLSFAAARRPAAQATRNGPTPNAGVGKALTLG